MDHVLYDLLKFVDHVLYAMFLNLWIMSVSGTRLYTFSFFSFVRQHRPQKKKSRSFRAQIETKLWLGRLIALSVEGPRAGSVFSLIITMVNPFIAMPNKNSA